MFILKKGHQPGVYVPLRALFLVHITFVQIGVFDWLSGRQKGSIFVKCLKIFFSETIMRMKPKLDIFA